MNLKKRPFVLIEVFIAIALLILCAFPLIRSSLQSFNAQKKSLLKLELERQAELYFYEVLKNKVPALHYNTIPTKRVAYNSFDPLEISFGRIKQTYYPHYHLFYLSNSESDRHKKIWCYICFPTKKGGCPNRNKNKRSKKEKERNKNKNGFNEEAYEFAFLVEKVEKNPVNRDGDKKEETVTADEKLSSNIQTVRPSQ